ncbi:MAG: PQQ-dependent sugar dehydrogenase [Sphingomonadales bacterium]|nr:PQQ-dependent sugar dehydrogenase [Sphingomonadales bacterium]
MKSIGGFSLILGLAGWTVSALAADETGITVPQGFTATVFADNLGRGRHMAVRSDGAVYLALRRKSDGSGIVALRDSDGDGEADVIRRFGDIEGTGIGFYKGQLYFGSDDAIWRFSFAGSDLMPSGDPELMISDFPEQRQHAVKPFTFDEAGNLYVSIGAPSNACQVKMRTKGSPGQVPCQQLERQSGIWRFSADVPGQTQEADGHRYATGTRNAMALDWNFEAGALFFGTHGRDQLSAFWPDFYSDEDNADLPSEEFHQAADGGNYGWPYTYWNHRQDKRITAPEYGGDGKTEATQGIYTDPAIGFPAHWAPNDLVFYTGGAFPETYHGGAFLAFHGSWNRAPLPQAGFNVVFIPFENGAPTGDWSVFADGFAGAEELANPRNARFRPTGVAVGPDGALYISDSMKGRVWRITYEGS